MVYYTGDTHGGSGKLLRGIKHFGITADDTIVILGDAGFNYYGNQMGDTRIKQTVCDTGVTVFCIHGNHEMRPETLPYYRETIWHGGAAYIEDEYPGLIFAKDGEVYELDGRSALVIGGAYSVDKYYRIPRGLHWFPDEQPSDEIKKRVEQKLEQMNWSADVVLTHTCPSRYTPVEAFLSGIDQSTVDTSTEEWLNSIEQHLHYNAWLCGHWHIDKTIDKLHFLMDDFIVLPAE